MLRLHCFPLPRPKPFQGKKTRLLRENMSSWCNQGLRKVLTLSHASSILTKLSFLSYSKECKEFSTLCTDFKLMCPFTDLIMVIGVLEIKRDIDRHNNVYPLLPSPPTPKSPVVPTAYFINICL